MLKKRIIGVINIKNDIAVQSIGYKEYLPLGDPIYLVENLDNWQVDEIIINCIDRSKKKIGPNYDLLLKLSKLKISTPITYGGGISSLNEAEKVISLGAERLCFDYLLNNNPSEICKISKKIGSQAIIGVLTLCVKNKKLLKYNYLNHQLESFDNWQKYLRDLKFISEILIVDYLNEGKKNSFDMNILNFIKNPNKKFLLFGGISNKFQCNLLLKHDLVSGICIGNFLNHYEHGNKYYQKNIKSNLVRKTKFKKEKYFL